MTVYFISSSPGPIISSHAWFPFRGWHSTFHSQPFHKRPRNLVYQKEMAERIKNKDFWLNWLGPHIINRKKLIKFTVSIRRGKLQWTFLGVFLLKCLILFLTKGLATFFPWHWASLKTMSSNKLLLLNYAWVHRKFSCHDSATASIKSC